MKRVILSFIAAMLLTCSYAENVNRYEISFDMRRLAAKLELTVEQAEALEVVQDKFNSAVREAGESVWFKRRHMMHKAVMDDARQMHRILDEKQFRIYMTLLMTTLRNNRLL